MPRQIITTGSAPGRNDEYAWWFPARSVAELGVELAGLLVSLRMAAFTT